MEVAMEEARKGLAEGGIPIGSCLVIDGKVVGKGHNQRVQKESPTLHGEIHCLEEAGRLKAKDYERATLYTTLSPCPMCSGAIRLFKIPRVVLAENVNFLGDEELLSKEGVELINLNSKEAIEMMKTFIETHKELWFEDIAI